MKKIFLLSALAVFLALPLEAQPPAANPYDLLSRALTPIATLFTPEAQPRALSAALVVEEMTGLPPERIGMRVELVLQPPDRALIRFPFQDRQVTFCRAGNEVWIAPNIPPFDALAALPDRPQKKGRGAAGLEPMTLPFPPQQLALLPIFFQVKDAGSDHGMRRIEARLMPELARGLGIEEWSARLTLDEAARPARIRILGPGWTLSVRVEGLEYVPRLPEETWAAPKEAIRLDAPQIRRGFGRLGELLEAYRPKVEMRRAEE